MADVWAGLGQKLLVSSKLPEAKHEYDAPAGEIVGWVSIMDEQVLQLSVAFDDGRHALGLMSKGPSYYVLDPNQGLYKFGNEAVYRRNLKSYLFDNCPPGSPWSLMAIVEA